MVPSKMTDEQRQIIIDTCEVCGFNSIPKAKLKKALDTLDGTFICKQNGIYRTLHDKLFDFLAHYFGQKMIECLIDHGDSDLLHERFICQKSSDDKNCNIDFIIEIPDDYLESYLQRFIKDWSEGKVSVVFSNINMEVSSFRQKLLQYLLQLDKSQQVTLANTKDTVEPKENYGSGNTPLVLTCYSGYTDMVQWVLHNNVNVEQGRGNGVTGLFMASQEGHADIVKLLLEKDTNVNLCNKNCCSPLLQASQNGHTDIAKLLLEKNPNVDLCNKNGCSPLFMASQEGHTDIVKLLLEKDTNVNLCNKNGYSPLFMASQERHTDIVKLLLEKDPNVDLFDKDGCSPLFIASNNGHTDIVKLLLEKNHNVDLCNKDGWSPLLCASLQGHTDIVKLLLENNADCNICVHSKQSIQDTLNNQYTLDKLKQGLFDDFVEDKSSHVADYGNKKSVDYAFDVVAGSSPLHFACFVGNIDIVSCLLDHNADINMTKEDGTTPLFYASEVGHENIVRLLLDKGADTQICRLDGASTLTIATDNGHTSIVIMLTNHIKKEEG